VKQFNELKDQDERGKPCSKHHVGPVDHVDQQDHRQADQDDPGRYAESKIIETEVHPEGLID
jgi:hypothetical protein